MQETKDGIDAKMCPLQRQIAPLKYGDRQH